MDTGEPLAPVVDQVMSANAYLGARPIVEALRQGAQIVLCGRVTDTALALAPMIHEFGWGAEDWDLPRRRHHRRPHHRVRRPVHGRQLQPLLGGARPLERRLSDRRGARGRHASSVTKHEGTGGMVTVDTVAEQLVYEMSDPTGYITPDVTADFTSIHLRQDGKDRVEVSGIQGRPNTPFLKISASYLAGYKASGQITLSGPRAVEKARLAAEIVWKRLERAGVTFAPEDRETELMGTGACLPGILPVPDDLPEVVLRLGVRDSDSAKVERFGKEIAPLVTAGPPGVTGFAGGRPKPQEIVAYWPALLAREEVESRVEVTRGGGVSAGAARAWYGGIFGGLLPILLLGFLYSAIADRTVFALWALVAGASGWRLLRQGLAAGWGRFRLLAALALVLAGGPRRRSPGWSGSTTRSWTWGSAPSSPRSTSRWRPRRGRPAILAGVLGVWPARSFVSLRLKRGDR